MHKKQQQRTWLRWLGVLAALAVVFGGAGVAGAGSSAQARTWVNGADIRPGTVTQNQVGPGGISGHGKTPESEIQGNSIAQQDIGPGGVSGSDGPGDAELQAGTVGKKDLSANLLTWLGQQAGQGPKGDKGDKGDDGEAGAPGKDGVFTLQASSLAAPKPVEHIGGPINDNATNLGVDLTLPAGSYVVTVDGAFSSDAAAADPSVDVWPQLSLWLDRNGDGAFRWQDGEGDISPNALMPTKADRHIWVHGTTVVTLDTETKVGLLGFGYTSTQGSERSGEIDVVRATLTATPLLGSE